MPVDTVVRHRWSDVPSETITPFIERRYISGDRVTVAQFQLRRGGVVPRHAHDNEQITCVMSGRLKFVLNGQDMIVGPGDVVEIPGGVEHEVHVLEDTLVMDVFSPIRQDWIDKTDHYFRGANG
jgi:quercetin dioxygenase-like cupin family protein